VFDLEVKVCSKCGESLPKTHEYFRKINKPCLFRSNCRACDREYTTKIRTEKREQVYEATRLWRENNKEKVKFHNQKYKAENPQYFKDYYQKHYEENKPKEKVRHSKYRLNNKEKENFNQGRRKTRLKGLPINFSLENWKQTMKHFDNKCAYCGEKAKLSRDHFIALSKGGEYTGNNIIPACISCNCSKQEFDFFEWYPNYKHYSKEREAKIMKYLNYKTNNVQQLALI
jgi:hypothetical protein